MAVQADTPGGLAKLVGSWNAEIAPSGQGTVPGLMTFTSDGIVLADEPPLPFETTGHGNWIATGPQEAAYTFVALIGNAEDKPASRIKLVGALTYDAQADTWCGPFKLNVFDATGQSTMAVDGTLSGARIAVERLG